MKINIKFKGIDDWNRPIYKQVDQPRYFGSCNVLVPSTAIPSTNPKDINDYFRLKMQEIEFFGNSFGCEPHGGYIKGIELNIID